MSSHRMPQPPQLSQFDLAEKVSRYIRDSINTHDHPKWYRYYSNYAKEAFPQCSELVATNISQALSDAHLAPIHIKRIYYFAFFLLENITEYRPVLGPLLPIAISTAYYNLLILKLKHDNLIDVGNVKLCDEILSKFLPVLSTMQNDNILSVDLVHETRQLIQQAEEKYHYMVQQKNTQLSGVMKALEEQGFVTNDVTNSNNNHNHNDNDRNNNDNNNNNNSDENQSNNDMNDNDNYQDTHVDHDEAFGMTSNDDTNTNASISTGNTIQDNTTSNNNNTKNTGNDNQLNLGDLLNSTKNIKRARYTEEISNNNNNTNDYMNNNNSHNNNNINEHVSLSSTTTSYNTLTNTNTIMANIYATNPFLQHQQRAYLKGNIDNIFFYKRQRFPFVEIPNHMNNLTQMQYKHKIITTISFQPNYVPSTQSNQPSYVTNPQYDYFNSTTYDNSSNQVDPKEKKLADFSTLHLLSFQPNALDLITKDEFTCDDCGLQCHDENTYYHHVQLHKMQLKSKTRQKKQKLLMRQLKDQHGYLDFDNLDAKLGQDGNIIPLNEIKNEFNTPSTATIIPTSHEPKVELDDLSSFLSPNPNQDPTPILTDPNEHFKDDINDNNKEEYNILARAWYTDDSIWPLFRRYVGTIPTQFFTHPTRTNGHPMFDRNALVQMQQYYEKIKNEANANNNLYGTCKNETNEIGDDGLFRSELQYEEEPSALYNNGNFNPNNNGDGYSDEIKYEYDDTQGDVNNNNQAVDVSIVDQLADLAAVVGDDVDPMFDDTLPGLDGQ